jgi:cysteinyl-tRNA synthetase
LNGDIQQEFQTAVDDDFNFTAGLAILFDLAKELRKEANLLTHEGQTGLSALELQQKWQTLTNLAEVFGLEAKLEVNEETDNQLSSQEIEELIAQRVEARKAKNYAESDRIRDLLKGEGVTLIDAPEGVTKWHRN